MEVDSVLPRDCADFRERLDGADFVVGVHDADQQRLRRNGAAHVLWIDQACPVDGKVCDRSAQPLEKRAGGKNGGMLDGRGDDVRSAARRGEVRALDGKVVRFAAAACEHDLIGRGAEQFRDLLTRPPQRRFRRALAQWPLEGLPNASSRNGRIASVTAGSIGVLA